MEMFSKKNRACGFFLPKAHFHVQEGMVGGTVFLENEVADLSAYLVCRRYGISHRNSILRHHSRREIAHQIVSDHVSGRIDPFEV